MGNIIILDENTSNKIAAGEVVERPASVVKEMVENSIDAGSTVITAEIKNGGVTFIKISDNGSGIAADDVEIAFERHSTSKLRSDKDLDSIITLGFRGEALASIASVSRVELTTKTEDSECGVHIVVEGGKVTDLKQVACQTGTVFVVRDLFYNTPARYKFLKKDSTEFGYISEIIGRMALGNPHISFKLINNGTTVMHTPGNNDLKSVIYSIYGKDMVQKICPMNFEDKVKITGFMGKPEAARSNREYQTVFLNGRYIRSKVVSAAIDEAYKTFIMKNKHPFLVMNIDVNTQLVDVNVHPTKMEVRFSEEQEIFRSVYYAVKGALTESMTVRSVEYSARDKAEYKFDGIKETAYTQQKIENPPVKPKGNTLDETNSPAWDNTLNKPYQIKTVLNEPIAPESITDKTIDSDETPIEAQKIPADREIPTVPGFEAEQMGNMSTFRFTENVVSQQSGQYVKEAAAAENMEEQKGSVPEDGNNYGTIAKGPETERKSEIYKDIEGDIRRKQIKEIFEGSVLIGQVFTTYVLLQKGNELLLIDQHAAHERILFEKIRDSARKNEPLAQYLLSPLVIDLTTKEIKFLLDKSDFFNKIGYIYEEFGNNSIILRSIPNTDANSAKDIFLETLDYVLNSWGNDLEGFFDETLFRIACKSAIKANMKLEEAEIKKMLEMLMESENPFTCPHGRPTVLKLLKHDMEKIFKRIV